MPARFERQVYSQIIFGLGISFFDYFWVLRVVYSAKEKTGMKQIKTYLSLWLPVVVWCSLIFYFSSIPNLKTAQDPVWDEVIRSVLHLIIYAVLFFLFFRAINAQKKEKNYFWPLILPIFYSISDELHQSLVPTRTFQLKDLVVDFLGIFLACLCLWKLLPTAPKKLRDWAKKYQLI